MHHGTKAANKLGAASAIIPSSRRASASHDKARYQIWLVNGSKAWQ
jgi:hypothetical protein